tara:strand:- start:36 stop:179 length:144 start_codon:yes stop_codon:yes gene_type:complete
VLLRVVMPEIIKKIPSQIKNNKLKSGLFFGLFAYWGVIIFGTLFTLN